MDSSQPLRIKRLKTRCRITLSSALGIAQAGVIYQELNKIVTDQRSVVIDARHVNRVDGAILQLLSAFCLARKRSQLPVACELSPEMADAAGLMHLSAMMELKT